MVVEAAAGVDLILAVREVRILAVGLRAAARKVLGHAGDARRAELVALEAADVRRGQATDQLEVLAERAADPGPARLGGDIRHRVQRDVDADRAVLLTGDLAEAGARAPRRASRRSRSARATARSQPLDQLTTAFSSNE